ncbi:MAG: ABC transporter substrate-binding protein [Pseudomonadota bacterium]
MFRALQLAIVGTLVVGAFTPGSAESAEPVGMAAPQRAVDEATADSSFSARVERLSEGSEAPEELIEGMLQVLREFAVDARGYVEDDPDRYYREIQAVMDPVLNFRRFARNVMAAPYKTATPEQRERFTSTFRKGLIETYSTALTQFDDGEVSVVPSPKADPAAKRRRVKTEIRTPAGDVFPVVYALAKEKDERWRIYNIVANGVNLGLTFRNQFKSAWDSNDRDLDKTIDAWAAIVKES